MHRIVSLRILAFLFGIIAALLFLPEQQVTADVWQDADVRAALERSGDNRAEIERAIAEAPAEYVDSMNWLVARMPTSDLQTLTAGYLIENLQLAIEAREASPWKDEVPDEIFLDAVLPYAAVNERRDDWRASFRTRFLPLIEGASTPGEAAVLLNQKVFPMVGVKYSTKRPKADQSGLESIDAGLASCTGLSVLLIEACRSVGVPARFVGTPLWSDESGNHSWVEVWDGGEWKYTGGAEPSGDDLNKGWFAGRASTAKVDDPRHSIYATTWRQTPIHFPMVWRPQDETVRAVNVTPRYTQDSKKIPDGHGRLYVRIQDERSGQRASVPVTILVDGVASGRGVTRDESFDANDHLEFVVPFGSEFTVRFELADGHLEAGQRFTRDEQMIEAKTQINIQSQAADGSTDRSDAGRDAIKDLRRALKRNGLDGVTELDVANTPLSKDEAREAAQHLVRRHERDVRRDRKVNMDARVLEIDGLKMPFWYEVYGDAPPSGRSLFISMHGGGGAPARVNTQQWNNQKKLYVPEEGVYVAPRAPTDTWNLWHQGHVDDFFDRLIENMIVFENVDPNRVYLMGYSAGGDGVYQLAPRMADRLGAAAMMAGHPNETQGDGLRNLPFTLHMGGEDGSYNRNGIAREWKQKLAGLAAADQGGYPHEVVIHEGKGHWMDREDAVAVPWMAAHDRNLRPEKIVWLQDDVTHSRFYWLAIDEPKARERIVVERTGNTVTILEGAERGLRIRADDQMFDLDQPIVVRRGDEVVFEGKVSRTIQTLARTLEERGDPIGVFSAEIVIGAVPSKPDKD